MFGYLVPFKPEMKVKEFECYRSVYCGLCKQLKADYGLVARMFLNYDLVLAALLADGLSGEEGRPCAERCMANPLAKRCMLHDTSGLRLAADGLLLTVWYKLADDVADEGFFKSLASRALRLLLRRGHTKAAARRPDLDKILRDATVRQGELEAAGSRSYDEAAEPTARMTAALFEACAAEQSQRALLGRMGSFLGRVIYFLDAAEDFKKDAAKGAYNVFVLNGLSKSEADEAARSQCRMAAAEAARCYTLLTFKLNKPIWDNILYLGLPASIQKAGAPRSRANRHPGREG